MAPKRTEITKEVAPQAKKAKKDPAAEKLKKQLAEITGALSLAGLPQEVQTLFTEVLPFSLGEFSDKRHRFQEQVTEKVSAILDEREVVLSKAVEDARSKHDEAASSIPATEQAALEAEASLEAKKAETQRLKIALAEKALAFKTAKHSVTEAETSKDLHAQKSQEAAKKKVSCEVALEDLKVLKTATPEDDSSRAKMDKLIKLLKEYKFDESMLIAVPAALAKAPDARGEFDHMAVEQLDVEIIKVIECQQVILSDNKPGEEKCELACKQAQAVLSKAKDEQKEAANNYISASNDQSACTEALSVAKTGVKDLVKSVGQLKQAVEEAEIEVELFQQGPKATFNSLRNRAAPKPESIEESAAPLPAGEQAMDTRVGEVAVVAAC